MPDRTIPQNDEPFYWWANAFRNVAVASPSVYSFTAGDVQLIQQTVDAYRAALNAAGSPRTRSAVTVAAKNAAKISLMQLMRRYVAQIQANAGVGDSDKIALGLHIRPRTNGRRTVPSTSPLLTFLYSAPVKSYFAVHDTLTPTVPAKPFGASGVQLFAALGDGPVDDPDAARYVGEFTRSRIAVDHEPAEAGLVGSYFARWIGHRKDVGPWSLPVHAVVPWPSKDSAATDGGSDKSGADDAGGESLGLAA